MRINYITNTIVGRNINFSGKQKEKPSQKIEDSQLKNIKNVPAEKLLPAVIALSGVIALNGCYDDLKYADMDDFKNEYFKSVSDYEKYLSKTDEKTYVFNAHKDSLYKETDDFKYNHVRVFSPDHTTVFGEIESKNDCRKIKFINVYDKDDVIKSSILKDPYTDETYYVNYTHNGHFKEIKNGEGEEIPSSKYGDITAILLLALGIYAAGHTGRVISEHRNKQEQ